MRDTEWLPKKTQGKSESQKRFYWSPPKLGAKGRKGPKSGREDQRWRANIKVAKILSKFGHKGKGPG